MPGDGACLCGRSVTNWQLCDLMEDETSRSASSCAGPPTNHEMHPRNRFQLKGELRMSDSSRSNLPIPDQPRSGLITYDAKDPDTKFPPIAQLRPPSGAPNVLIVLIDDPGYGSSSAFGGPCQTPNAEKLAAGGL